jgi:hypothetical protein
LPQPGKFLWMHVVFADDAGQNRPRRTDMTDRPFLGIGGFIVDADRLRDLEQSLGAICQATGFPPGCEFKWSPPADNWMHHNLVQDARDEFFECVLASAREHDVAALVVAEDTVSSTAIQNVSPERDVLELFLERVSYFLGQRGSTGLIIADQPGGGPRREHSFLVDCLEARERGTDYVTHERLALSVVCAKSHFVRCLQLADLIVSCTLARITGSTYASRTFEAIRPLLHRDGTRVGGIGLKIHPDFRYANLYHWLVGDSHHWKRNWGIPLPHVSYRYFESENA